MNSCCIEITTITGGIIARMEVAMITGFDHIVLVVDNVAATCRFYAEVLGMDAREESPGKWALFFGANKISLQEDGSAPALAKGTVPGSGNFCLLTQTPITTIAKTLRNHNIDILDGPAEKIGATGRLMSVYFRDPDGNLVEVSNRLD